MDTTTPIKAIVIGAGPAGLAAAACLKQRGIAPVILERAETVGAIWRRHYDRLRLHTPKGRSTLPGRKMPRDWPRYPSRDQLVAYLEGYAADFDLAPVFGAEVETLRQEAGAWVVAGPRGTQVADVVVLATGMAAEPVRPDVPGLADFPGLVLHSSEYRGPQQVRSRALVVGFGNSAGDIALDLAEAGRSVGVSVRGGVTILPKQLLGIPIVSYELLPRLLGPALADAVTAPVRRVAVGRPEDYGLRSAEKGPARRVVEDGKVPLIDVGTLGAIRDGRISVHPGLARFDGEVAVFADGTRREVDAVVLGTGYRCDLRPLLGPAADVLDPEGRPQVSGGATARRGLYFCSYHVAPNGQLRQICHEAEAIARDVSREFGAGDR